MTSPKKLVPDDFIVPLILETASFRLRMLSVQDVEKDFDAVITSAERLRQLFPHWDRWPREGFTLAENLADLQRHQAEFERREGFTYTVTSLDESQVLGCVYIYPHLSQAETAAVYLWVRDSEYKKGLDPLLWQTVKSWLNEAWPFLAVTFPGRDGSPLPP